MYIAPFYQHTVYHDGLFKTRTFDQIELV